MTAAGRRSALAALEAARPGMTKLDAARDPEEIAADIIEFWSSVETALRSLMGGSTLSGQALIRELRTRELISLDQAHSLLELQAVRERVDDTAYQPTRHDIDTAREAYDALQSGLASPASASVSAASRFAPETTPTAASSSPLPSASAEPPQVYVPPPREEDGWRRRRSLLLGALLILLAAVLVAGGVYWYRFRSALPSDVRAAVALYERGQPEAARAAFVRAARAHPEMALPHLYLGRIARSEGDFAAAGNELRSAIELEPQNTLALTELGALFLARGTSFANQGRSDLATADYNRARHNYVRALQNDPSDSTARGFLGCALARLGRTSEAERWLARAGSGPWMECAHSGAAADSAARGP